MHKNTLQHFQRERVPPLPHACSRLWAPPLNLVHSLEPILNKYLSYRRETALQGALVWAKGERLELGITDI